MSYKEEYIAKHDEEAYEILLKKSRQYYKTHRKEIDARHKIWAKGNPERVKKTKKKYRVANRSKLIENSTKWQLKNKEHCINYRKKYYIKNKEELDKKHLEYYYQHKVEISIYTKEYKKENKEKISLWHKKHYKENKETILKQHKTWCQTKEGKECMGKSSAKRKLYGFNIIAYQIENKFLSPLVWHHLSDEDVIRIPEWIHVRLGGYDKEKHRQLVLNAIRRFFNEKYYNIENIDKFEYYYSLEWQQSSTN